MCGPKVLFGVGGTIVVVAAVFAGVFGVIFTAVLEGMLVIDPDNSIYDTWITPPVPVYMAFYFFTVNNPIEVQYYSAKPDLTEIGPFTYEETLAKFEIEPEVPGAPGTIEYKSKKRYNFVRSMSVADEDYSITSMNPIAVLSAALLYNNLLFRELIWPEIERTMDLFEEHTVEELLFVGFKMPEYNFDFPDRIPIIGNSSKELTGTLHDILCEFDVCLDILEGNRVGYFLGANNSNDGLYRVNTGSEGMDEYLHIREWKGNETLHFWNDQFCDMINGTDGTQFPPGVDKDTRMYLYTSDLCRAIYLTYEKEIKVQNEVNAWRFTVPAIVLDNPNTNADNKCYCVKVYEDDEGCPTSSMLNLASCSGGAPIVLSTPHFYQGDGEDLKFVGLNPSKSLHETFLDIEPISGFVLSASKKIQINLPLRQYGNFPMFQSVPDVIFPIFWGDEYASVDKDDAKDVHKALTIPFIIGYTLCGVLIVVGLAIIYGGYVKMKRMGKKREQEAPLVNLKY